jgi:hypothetical protein
MRAQFVGMVGAPACVASIDLQAQNTLTLCASLVDAILVHL